MTSIAEFSALIIVMGAVSPIVYVVLADVPAGTLREFVALAKADLPIAQRYLALGGDEGAVVPAGDHLASRISGGAVAAPRTAPIRSAGHESTRPVRHAPDRARRHVVDGDPERRQFHAQRIAQGMHRRLRGAIGAGKWRHQHAGNAADVHHQTLGPAQHREQKAYLCGNYFVIWSSWMLCSVAGILLAAL